MRTLALLLAAATLSACGYREEDPELDAALAWTREFKAEQPELSRELAKQCEQELTENPYFNRDAALQMFQCMRAKAGE